MVKSYNSVVFNVDNEEYHSVRIGKELIDSLTELFNKSRNRNISKHYFRNKYETAWTGKENIGILICNSQNEVLGHLGILPMEFQYNDRNYQVGQISDAVLDPRLRGKNVFEILINETEKLAAVENLDFLFVIPSPQAVNGFVLNEWKDTGQLLSFSKDIKALPLNKASNKFHLEGLYHFYIKCMLSFCSKKKNELKNPCFQNGKGGNIIGESYVKHKNYSKNYLIYYKGFTFWFKIEDGMEIGGVEFFEKEKLESFIRSITRLSKLLGSNKVKITTFKGTFLDDYFTDFERLEGNKLFFKPIMQTLNFNEIVLNGCDLNTF